MHKLQLKLLDVARRHDLRKMTLREIGEFIGEKHPQKIKHHLQQLGKRGLLTVNKSYSGIQKNKLGRIENTKLIAIPIMGAANCGEATLMAEENMEGILRVSKNMLKKSSGLFAIRAIGDSMNKANINDESIEEGDFVIVDSQNREPKNGDYILSVIDGCANIKKFQKDGDGNILLVSESTNESPPIYIHPKDFSNYMVNGKVIRVIKKPPN